MQTLKSVVTGLCSMALVLTPMAAPLAGAVAEEPWEIAPEDSLRDLRGGMDLGDLVASFAIERVVEINGMVVARMQLVISNLDRLAKGGMPTITVTGPMAEIVQFMKTAGNVSIAGKNGSIPASVPSLPAAPPAAGAGAAASAGPTVASSGNSGTVSATGTQSGSMTQMGSALTHAVTAAATATGSPSTASSLASTAGSTANVPAIAASNTHLQASTTPTASAQPVSTSAASTTMTIPVGTTGQAVVLSNLPNAAALTTAVQNEVHAATIQTQTTISATINSMPALNAISLSNSIRAAVSGGG
jgi:hypothetical protein